MNLREFQSGASPTAPSRPGSPSTGYPSAGNPGSGVAPTVPGPYWFHQVSEELRAVITAAGLTPDATNLAQLLAALRLLIAGSQAWTDVTASRVSGTTYTNTTDRPIQVLVSLPDTAGLSPTVTINVGGVAIVNAFAYDIGTSAAGCLPSFIVPAGATYTVTVAGSGTIARWAELR